MSIFSSNKPPEDTGLNRNWYADRCESITVQRNMLFLIAIISLIATVISVIFVAKVTISKTIEPLVVEVENTTGFTNLVNPNDTEQWSSSKSVNTYFLVNYLRSREAYNVASYVYDYNTVTRLMSSSNVYREFKQKLNNAETNPVIIYGSQNSTFIKIRSIEFLDSTPSESTAQIRFSIIEQGGSKKVYNKIVSVVWGYIEMNLNFDDRTVNPLGFQVKSYSISDDVGE